MWNEMLKNITRRKAWNAILSKRCPVLHMGCTAEHSTKWDEAKAVTVHSTLTLTPSQQD